MIQRQQRMLGSLSLWQLSAAQLSDRPCFSSFHVSVPYKTNFLKNLPAKNIPNRRPTIAPTSHMSSKSVVSLPLVLLFFSSGLQSYGQTIFTWNGGTGSWASGSDWSTGTFPNSAAADVRIDGDAGVNSTVNATSGTYAVGRLAIDAGDTLSLGTYTELVSDDSGFAGAGTWTINGTLLLPVESAKLRGARTLNGTGKIVFGAATAIANDSNLYDDVVNNITVEGTARWGANNTAKPRIVNNGTINANVPGAAFELRGKVYHYDDPALHNINTGVLKSTLGGTLLLGQGAWISTEQGQIIAEGAGSQVVFAEDISITGGSIIARDGGEWRQTTSGSIR
jgi:hypothetical protein